MSESLTSQSDAGVLRRVLVKHARSAFPTQARIDAEWRDLGFTARPDVDRALEEYEAFHVLLTQSGAQVDELRDEAGVTIDSIYVRDASVICDRGVVLCRMGKRQRAQEPDAQERFYVENGWPILGRITPPGLLEGGDVVWIDRRTLAVGVGYRTNAEGVRQLRELLGDSVDEVIPVALPHWRGPADVFHLMSIVSPVAPDAIVVFSPLLSVPFRELLLEHGFRLIEVPDDEFERMGTNVLALGPTQCVALAGNPQTRRLLEAAGIEVFEYEGQEISVKGGGGPTCLTRPLSRMI